MPLTKKGKSIMADFLRRYGKRGKEVFYRTANKRPAFDKTVHGKRRSS